MRLTDEPCAYVPQTQVWEAFVLAAKGYHLRIITEQVTAVAHVHQHLAHAMAHLQDDLARRAQ